MNPERLRPERIRDDVRRLAAIDPSFREFGADSHRYQLHPVVARGAIETFEREYAIRLPEDYVSFLTEIGNGGAGPYYGVFRLGKWGYSQPWDFDVRKGRSVGDPSRPFPHAEQWDQEAEEKARGVRFGNVLFDGALPISFMGCAGMVLLAVSGPERGHVWVEATSEAMGCWPWKYALRPRVTFLEWYATWLDRGLEGKQRLFGSSM